LLMRTKRSVAASFTKIVSGMFSTMLSRKCSLARATCSARRLTRERSTEFSRALRNARLESGVEFLERILGLPTLAPILQELLDGARHVGNLVAAMNGHACLDAADITVTQEVADPAQPRHDVTTEECMGDQPGKQQAHRHLAGHPHAGAVYIVGEALNGFPIISREIVRLIAGCGRQGVGLAAKIVVEAGQ
jgi:hypothetical protein